MSTQNTVLIASGIAIVISFLMVKIQRGYKAYKQKWHEEDVADGKLKLEEMRSRKSGSWHNGKVISHYVENGRYTYAELGTTFDEVHFLRERIYIIGQVQSYLGSLRKAPNQKYLDDIAKVRHLLSSHGIPPEEAGTSAKELDDFPREIAKNFAKKEWGYATLSRTATLRHLANADDWMKRGNLSPADLGLSDDVFAASCKYLG